jgi:hypothetical protein
MLQEKVYYGTYFPSPFSKKHTISKKNREGVEELRNAAIPQSVANHNPPAVKSRAREVRATRG